MQHMQPLSFSAIEPEIIIHMVHEKDKKSPAQIAGYPRATLALGAVALTLVVFQAIQLFRLINHYTVDVPYWDQWGFYNAFFEPHGLWEIFSWQHGPHRQGAGFLITWAVNAATDWDQRAQVFVIGIVMSAAAAAFLWLKRRLFGSLQWHDTIPVLMILSLKPMEIYFTTPNVSHGALPLLLIILLCIALTIHNMLLRYCLAAAFYFLAIFTGFGLLAAPILPVLLITDCLHRFQNRQWKQACIATGALICCLTAIACFYHKYHFSPAVDCFQFPDENWYLYPVFMAITFSTTILPDRLLSLQSITIGLLCMGLMLYMLAMVFVKLRPHDAQYPRYQSIFVLIAFSLVFSAATATGRLCLGLEASTATRYVPLIMPGFIGAYLFSLNVPVLVKSRTVMPVLFAAAVLLMLTGWPWQRHFIAVHNHKGKEAWVAAFKQTTDVNLAGTLSGYLIYPDPEQTDLARKLEWLRVNRYSLFRDNAAQPE
jgi:hypothetical protein